MTTHELTAGPDDAGQRLDRWLAAALPELSRSRIQALIKSGQVSAGETIGEPRHPVKPGTTYRLVVPDAVDSDLEGEAIALNILYEDDALIVVDKPAGLVVHPSSGHDHGTLVHALIAHCGDSLSGIGGIRRPGIVHRLDKDTSGVMVVAKTDAAHAGLADQFRSHGRDGRLSRQYQALAWGVPVRPAGSIDAALARSANNRTKIAVVSAETGREAITHFRVDETFAAATGEPILSLFSLELETGRTHQIRVHLAHIGHPLVGDPVYGPGFKTRVARLPERARAAAAGFSRQALHAATLGFEHPLTGKPLSFASALPTDFADLLAALRGGDQPIADMQKGRERTKTATESRPAKRSKSETRSPRR